MSDMNVRALACDVVRSSVAADPGDLADTVFDSIAEDDRPEALRQCLRALVRDVIRDQRTRSSQPPGENHGCSAGSGRSSKVAGIRSWWQQSLRDRIHVGDGQWRFLADMTRDELLFAATERRRHAEHNLARAQQYESLAKLLADRGVERVRDLPDGELDDTLEAAA